MDISGPKLEASFRYASRVILNTLPGMAVLEIVFDRGFFAGNIENTTALVLLLIWAVFLSFPFDVSTLWLWPYFRRMEEGFADEAQKIAAWKGYQRGVYQLLFVVPLIVVFYLLDLAGLRVGMESPVQRYLVVMATTAMVGWPWSWWFERLMKWIGSR